MQSGQRVGKYVLGERIAHGGMAEVWAARVEGPGGFVKPLALKFLRESFAGDSELERLFVNEARLAARLQHANLVGVFDFDRLGRLEAGAVSRYYIAMERVEGQDLRRVMQSAWSKGRRIPAPLALYIAGEVLKGLRYVHERRDDASGKLLELVHRDVSPHNVLVGMHGDVKLSDFGIAKARALTGNVHTQAGTVRGKLAYAAPEQLRAEALDHRADQFALGIILWELLAHRRLFDGTSEREILEQVLGGRVPPLATAALDPAVERLTRRMLSARPGDRFPSTADALNAILTAPGYRPDARPLVELMSALFAPPPVAVPRTAPLDLADPAPQKAMAVTLELERPLLGEATGSSPPADRSSGLRSYLQVARSRTGRLAVMAVGLGVVAVGAGVGLRRVAARRTLISRPPSGEATAVRAPVAPPFFVPPPPSPQAPPAVAAPLAVPAAAEPEPAPPPSPLGERDPSPPFPSPEPARLQTDRSTTESNAARLLAPTQARAAIPASAPHREDPPPLSPPVPMAPLAAPPTGPPTQPAEFNAPPALQQAAPARSTAAEKHRRGTVPNAAPILE